MPRRRREYELPGFFQALEETAHQKGYGLAVELAKALAVLVVVALISGCLWFAFHFAITGVQHAILSAGKP